MEHIYILIILSTAAISSVFTIIFIKRNVIWAKWVDYKSRRFINRKKRLKSLVEPIVYEYLEELKNGTTND